MRLDLEYLKGVHQVTLCAWPGRGGIRSLASQTRIDRDGYSHWFVVCSKQNRRETQSIAEAIRWFNEL